MKRQLRAHFRAVRHGQSHLDPLVHEHLYKLVEKFSKIALYISMKNEVNLESLINKLLSSKEIYLPAVQGELVFHRLHAWTDLKPDQAHILAPIDTETIAIHELDCIIMPCIAANLQGYRLGYGGGYFDRALAHYKGIKIGVVIENCITTEQFQESYDIPLDYVVTDQRIITITKKG
ncbi:MAG: 5-formyltetrahydrofolate cyclo-ligase [Bacilli bacterium]